MLWNKRETRHLQIDSLLLIRKIDDILKNSTVMNLKKSTLIYILEKWVKKGGKKRWTEEKGCEKNVFYDIRDCGTCPV